MDMFVNSIGFLIHSCVAVCIILYGLYLKRSKNQTRGRASSPSFAYVEKVSEYNNESANLILTTGVIFFLLGFPFLAGQNHPAIIISILGYVFSVIYFIYKFTTLEDKYISIKKK